jgi:hypothetical protein
MTTDPQLNELGKLLLRPESVAAVRDVLVRIDQLSIKPDLRHQAGLLSARAFSCLRELAAGDPDLATAVLLHDLLPRCLAPTQSFHGEGFSRLFGQWLDDLPPEHRKQVRRTAMLHATAAFDEMTVRLSLRLIVSIGYWDDGLLARLDQLIASSDNETGDDALSVRAWLAPVPESIPDLLRILHRRIEKRRNFHLIYAAQPIGTAETVDVIWSNWISPKFVIESTAYMFMDATMSILSQIAARAQEPALSALVWQRMSVASIDQPVLQGPITYNPGVAPQIDLPDVIPGLLEFAARADGHARYVYYERLQECSKLAHQIGWDLVSPTSLDVVRKDARTPTGMTGKFSTFEMSRKEAAWALLLCRGDRSLVPPLADAIEGETSGYVLHRFQDLGGCLAYETLPSEVSEFIAGAPSRETWSDEERLVAQIGAIRTAHGSSNRSAFEALLGYRKLGSGVLLSVVDALAETVISILNAGDRTPVRQIINIAGEAQREDSRGAAAAAVAILLEKGHLTPDEEARASALTYAPGTDHYPRKELLFSFATRPPNNVPISLIQYAESLLDRAPAGEGHDLRPAALALIAQQPAHQNDEVFLTTRLGLRISAGGVSASPDAFRGVIPHLIGQFYVNDLERFSSAAASILESGGTGAISHLLPFIRKVGFKNAIRVTDALLARLKKADEGHSAELTLIDALGAIAPEKLLNFGCIKMKAWLPEARAYLADVLGRLSSLSTDLSERRFEILHQLALDGIYSVRRAAFRSAVRTDVDRLKNLITSWGGGDGPDDEGLRRRAAECSGWLSSTADVSLTRLKWDHERGVREAYERSDKDREERTRAEEYARIVTRVRHASEVISAWRYGVALSKIGDDSSLESLTNRLQHDLPPSVRFWLSRLRKALEVRWGSLVRSWPDPLFAHSGYLEGFDGIMQCDGKGGPAKGTLWRIHPETPRGLSSWGGWGMSEGYTGFGPEYELLIPGRQPAKIYINSRETPIGRIVFRGSGRYPDVDDGVK